MSKKTILPIVIASLIMVILTGGYFYLNFSFKEKAKTELEKFIKEHDLVKNFSYKNFQANFISRKIILNNVKLTIGNKNVKPQEILIKTLSLKGNLNNNYKIYLGKLKIITPLKTPEKNIKNNPILTVKYGTINYKKKKDEITYSFTFKNIILNQSALGEINKEPKELKNMVYNIIRLNEPIDIQAKVQTDEKNGSLNIDKYQIGWEKNFSISYSLYLNNVDFKKIENLAKEINSQKNRKNLLLAFELIGELSKIKPLKIAIEFKDNGIKERITNYILKNDNITKEQLLEAIKRKLGQSILSEYKNQIMYFMENKDAILKLTIDNPNRLEIGDILKEINSISDINKVLKINLTN